jgi:hypothetical protein
MVAVAEVRDATFQIHRFSLRIGLCRNGGPAFNRARLGARAQKILEPFRHVPATNNTRELHLMRRPRLLLTVLLSSCCAALACGSGGQTPGSHWAGKSYLLDTPEVPPPNWIQPKGFGSDVGAYVPQFLIGVAAGTGDDLTITLATALEGSQDMCVPTAQITASATGYPNLAIATDALKMRIKDTDPSRAKVVKATARNLQLNNILPGESPAKDGELIATVSVAELYPLFYQIPNATKDSVCSAFAQAGVTCQPCPSDQQPYCLTLKAVQIGAAQVATQVVPVSEGSIDPSCS